MINFKFVKNNHFLISKLVIFLMLRDAKIKFIPFITSEMELSSVPKLDSMT